MSYDLVRQAILSKQAISALYHGQYREMCPHVLGFKNGKRHALFYQFAGRSNSRPIQPDGSTANWRCIDIGELSQVEIIEIDKWHSAPDHTRPQTCVDQIDAVVAY